MEVNASADDDSMRVNEIDMHCKECRENCTQTNGNTHVKQSHLRVHSKGISNV